MDNDDDIGTDQISDDLAPRRTSRPGRGVALVAAGLLAGGTIAGVAGAYAASGSSASPSSGATPSSGTSTSPKGDDDGDGDHAGRAGGPNSVRSDEKELTGATAAKVKAAALKAVPGATIYRVETDAGDGVYEAHLRKADGTLATVKLDKNFVVTKVEDGMGLGDPRRGGGRDHDGDRDGNRDGNRGPGGTGGTSTST
jgi:hypothetical protein